MTWKRIGKALLYPPLWIMTLLSILCAGGLVAVFLKGLEATLPAYLLYVLSFYTLTVVCIYCSIVLPKRCRRIKARADENPFIHRYATDRQFRARISLYLSLGINIVHIALQCIQWYVFRSWWFVVLAVYYSILSLMRFLLVRYVQRHAIGSSLLSEWKRSRTCACILLLISLSLSGAVLMILFQHRGWEYAGILIYVIALYTFYSAIHAVIDLIKYRKLGSPILSTAKIVSLSAALVSLLNLETAMFSQFGKDMAPEHQQIFIILTGAGVSIIVVTLSVLLICRANKEIRRKTMNQESFDYTYSAEQRQEIEHIRKKYLPKEEDKMQQLRRLHYSATGKAKSCAMAVGVVGTLILGTGMSLTMTDIGAQLGHLAMVLGIIVGLIGIVMVALAYPVYNRVLKNERARIAPEILRLTEELLK